MAPAIHRLEQADTPTLAAFAEACFREAYAGHFAAAHLDALCAAAFALSVMERLVLDGVWVARDWQGYAALGQLPCPLPSLAAPSIELARLYVPRCGQGKGIADSLMGRFLAEAEARGGRSVWLQAFRDNPRALAFYRRWGFTDFGPFDLLWEGISLPHRLLGRNL